MTVDTDTTSAFARLWALGYKRLVPIIPPDAQISEGSLLYRRVGTHQDGRGKTPGVRGHAGTWYSFDWAQHEAEPDDVRRWSAMGAGTGIKTGGEGGLVAIDADTMDKAHAKTIHDTVVERLGRLPVRIGNHPKAIYVCRVSAPLPYQRIEFGQERVEVLTDGRQFVAAGVHPKTGRPYDWPRELVPFDDLPVFDPSAITGLLEALRARLPEATPIRTEGANPDRIVNQDALRGPLETVRRAVKATPNTSASFPTREAYRDFGYAIKAALPDNEAEALDLFQEWCARWTDGENDPAIVEADWRRMKPPFRRGAAWLYEVASAHGSFDPAEVWFEPVRPDAALFPEISLNALKEEATNRIAASPYTFPDPTSIPRREFLYGWHYVRQFVSATVAPSGVGKSSLEVVEALAMASGKPLLGEPVRGQWRVWLWNGEDPLEEMQRRVAAAMAHYGLSRDDVGDRLFVDTGRQMQIVLAEETRDGARIAAPVAGALLETLRANRIDVMQIDPFVSSHRVSENDNGAIDLVTKAWARIADAARCSVELVHHVRKLNGAEITVEDSRGAGALLATSRSARALSRMTRAEAGVLGLPEGEHRRLFRFGDAKNNLALPTGGGDADWFGLASVPLGNGGIGTADIDALAGGDSVGVVTRWVLPDASASLVGDDEGRAMDALRGGVWRKDIRARDGWAGAAVGAALRLDMEDPHNIAHTKALLKGWLAAGKLREVTRQDAKRMPRTFIEVVEKPDTLSENMFE